MSAAARGRRSSSSPASSSASPVGLASAVAPVYISEVAPPESRGRLVTFFQLAVTIGILVAYLVGLAFDPIEGWRWMLGLGAVPAIVLGFGMLRMPQSPRWLVMAGEDYEARAVLTGSAPATRTRSSRRSTRSTRPSTRSRAPGGTCCGRPSRPRWSSASAWRSSSRCPGSTRSSTTRRRSSSSPASILVGGDPGRGRGRGRQRRHDHRRDAAARPRRPPAAAADGHRRDGDRARRRSAIVFAIGAGSTVGSIVAVGGLMLYVAAFAISLGPIFWLLNSEIYPLRVRSKAAAMGTMANWTFNFIVSLTFLPLIDAARPQRGLLVLRRRSAWSRSSSAGSSCRRRRASPSRTSSESSRSAPGTRSPRLGRMSSPRELEAWQALERHHAELPAPTCATSSPPTPTAARSSVVEGRGPLPRLLQAPGHRRDHAAARRAGRGVRARERLEAMFRGDRINVSENRSVLHVALRVPGERSWSTGANVVKDVHEVLDRMGDVRRPRPLRRVEGPYRQADPQHHQHRHRRLGPRPGDGLRGAPALQRRDMTFRFVSNVDGTDFAEATRDLDAAETLFIVCSKTFTTLETMTNAHTAREWALAALGGDEAAIAKHFVAVSTNAEGVRSSASTPTTCSGSGSGSAGATRWTRRSGCRRWSRSAPRRFAEMLAGFHAIDEHFRTAPFEREPAGADGPAGGLVPRLVRRATVACCRTSST